MLKAYGQFKFMILILSKELDLSYINYEEATLLYTDIALNKYIT